MFIPVIVLIIVFLLIAFRQVSSLKLQIWKIMLFGAIAVLVTGQISAYDALKSINLDVMLFLFGMFVIGRALEESGYLSHLSYRLFRRARTVNRLLLLILFGVGFFSAFLMNDTLAIIGTPVVLLLARKHSIPSKALLLALAFAVTIGSVMSPIGNPQNLLIAVNSNIKNPFVEFLKFLFVPTIINLFLAFFILKLFYRGHFHKNALIHSDEPIKDENLAILSKISLMLVVFFVIAKILFVIFIPSFGFRITYIALFSMIPVLLSRKRLEIVRGIDWHTLVFFASMFILMESVWDTSFFQTLIGNMGFSITSISAVLIVSIILSQLISNVPLVALYLPMLAHAGASSTEMVALAAGSTIAGNLLILGAASNVIIVQNAEKRGEESLTFFEFAKIGIPLTVLNALVYWIFFIL